jgi:hypothetical protein
LWNFFSLLWKVVRKLCTEIGRVLPVFRVSAS